MTYPVADDADGLASLEPSKKVLERFLPDGRRPGDRPRPGPVGRPPRAGPWVVESVEVPTVLDADALNALAGQTEILATLKRPVILTPHPGEFARLTGRPPPRSRPTARPTPSPSPAAPRT